MLENQIAVARAILVKWSDNPLTPDLKQLSKELTRILNAKLA